MENFEVRDVSSQLTFEHRLYIEAEILEHFAYHKYRYDIPDKIEEYIKEIRTLLFPKSDPGTFEWGINSGPDLFNKVTEGRFFDNHNVNHVVNGQRMAKKFLIKPFDFESQMETKNSRSKRSLFLCSGYNTYAEQISKPLVIFNPKDINARKFVEESYEFHGENLADYVVSKWGKARLRKDDKGNVGYCVSGHGHEVDNTKSPLYRLLFLANYPILPDHNYEELVFNFDKIGSKDIPEYKWSDIASEMVNFCTGKLYKRYQKVEDGLKVERSIQYYRKLLREKVGIDFEIDKNKEIKDLKKR